jgi:hypothetical protein
MNKGELEDFIFQSCCLSDLKFRWENRRIFNEYEEIIHKNCMLLKEGLIKTYPLNSMIGMLSKYGESFYNSYNHSGGVLVLANNYLNGSSIEMVNKVLDAGGYYVSYYSVFLKTSPTKSDLVKKFKDLPNMEDIHQLWIIYEAKFDSIVDISNIHFLYHLTEKRYLERIKRDGLVPRANNKLTNHPDRIYFTMDEVGLNMLLPQFINLGKSINEYIILRIDYRLANKPKLMLDPNFSSYGVYTTENIPFSAINGMKYL